jgi:hypothetical protein
VTFTATVSAVSPGGGTPAGTVQFKDGDNNLGSAVTLSGGVATYSTADLSVGTHTITAVYTPATNPQNYNGSTSGDLTTGDLNQQVGKASATVNVTGGSYTYDGEPHAATVTTTPQGRSVDITYALQPNGTPSSSAPVNAGTYAVVAIVNDPNYQGSGSGTLTINKATPTITVSGDGSFPYDGDPHTATGSVKGVKNADLGAATITYDPAANPALVNVGTYKIIASFAGNQNYNQASDNTNQIVITQAEPTVNITGGNFTYDGNRHPATGVSAVGVKGESLGTPTVSYAPGSPGATDAPLDAGSYTATASFAGNQNYKPASKQAAITIGQADATVNVTGGSFPYDGNPHPATGSVTGVGGANLGTPSFKYTPPGDSTVPVNVGTYDVLASFAGNKNYKPASNTAKIVIEKAATATTVSASPTPSSVFGQSVTFTATVKRGTAAVTGGTVTFKVGTTVQSVALNASGQASFDKSDLPVGPHTITAEYSGDTNHDASSGSVNHRVDKAATTTSVSTSKATTVFGEPVTFTANVMVTAPGAGTPGGTVEFFDGATSLGTKPLSGGTATLTTGALSVGSHIIKAVYTEGVNFLGSNGSVTQQVNKANTSTALASSANPSVFGQPVTFTATVSPTAPGAGTRTGTVQFKVGSADRGSPVALNPAARRLRRRSRTCPWAAMPSRPSTAVTGNFEGQHLLGALSQAVEKASTSTALSLRRTRRSSRRRSRSRPP